MTEDAQARKKHRRIWFALAVVLGLLIAVVAPPLVSMSRYKASITRLMSESLGRSVRLSSVELRLLPVPEFVLSDLTVQEDPAYGAEPVLHANTVTASIRLLSLWRGRLEISTISVDEASLNVVRTPEGRWNLDPLFRTAAARAQPAGEDAAHGRPSRMARLPYLEATNSRINFKRGAEKLPFSLVNTDLSFWQENPGEWRIRLRGQPARTDVSLDLADTGVVRLEARAQRAPELRQVPLHVDLEWSEAQLGQLTRLLVGSDPGWRGDLTGEAHLDGTPEAAQIKARLRATGVHRAEFAPAAPMDFDATCGFLYHFTARSLDNLACDSPLGDGRIHVTGGLPGNGAPPHISIELNRIPVAAGLDALRTVRSNFGPGLEAAGTVSGKITYAQPPPEPAVPEKRPASKHGSKGRVAGIHPPPGPLTGSLTVDGFELSGDDLSMPIEASKLVLEPAATVAQPPSPGWVPPPVQPAALEATVTIPAGGATPLTVIARLALSGYQLSVHGPASIARGKELARVAGMADAAALESLAGDPVAVDLDAAGPWLPAPFAPAPRPLAGANAADVAMGVRLALDENTPPATDTLIGTVTVRNANWKADYLSNHVLISQAVLHLDNGRQRWDPLVFSYGPVKGTATIALPVRCDDSDKPCADSVPTFTVHFAELDAAALQAAILGAHEPGTLLSSLIARLKPSDSSAASAWPKLEGSVKADSLVLGPVTLTAATAKVSILHDGAEIDDLDAGLLGGQIHGSGDLRISAAGAKPAYTLNGGFEKLNAARLGQLLGMKWSGGAFEGSGKIELAGFTDKDLAGSAKGTLHFDWRHGAIAGQQDPETGAIPPALVRFDLWTGDAAIANNGVALTENEVQQASKKWTVAGGLTFGDPPRVTLTAAKESAPGR